jgi:phosphohistidine phosphatase SixA
LLFSIPQSRTVLLGCLCLANCISLLTHAQEKTQKQEAPRSSPASLAPEMQTVKNIGTPVIADRKLVGQFLNGGYVFYMRHSKTDHSQKDTDLANLDNVAAQRQLTDEGRGQAKQIGDAIRLLKIPLESVICSKLARATETAKLLAIAPVEPTVDVSEGAEFVGPSEKARRADFLRELLTMPPAIGKNLLIVGHRPNLKDVVGDEQSNLEEGEMAVYHPKPGGELNFVVKISPETWTEWTSEMAMLKQEIAEIKGKLPDQAHAMVSVAYHFNNLWFAAQEENWPLAQFYWNEVRSHMRWAVRIIPIRKDSQGKEIKLQPLLDVAEQNGMKAMSDAILAKEKKTFVSAYQLTMQSCYGCHIASEKPYLRVKLPDQPAEPMIDFKLPTESK